MSLSIDWLAFVQVFLAALFAAVLVVGFYSLGLRLLVRAGRAPVVAPAEFTDAITVITAKDAQRAAKAAAKAAQAEPADRRPATGSPRSALTCASGCARCGARRAAADRLQPLSASRRWPPRRRGDHSDGRSAAPRRLEPWTRHPCSSASIPPARRTLLHVSDTHLLAGNAPLGGRFDTAANLRRTLEAVERLGIRPDAIVFTGDLTDLGEPEAYRGAARGRRARRRAARRAAHLGRRQPRRAPRAATRPARPRADARSP